MHCGPALSDAGLCEVKAHPHLRAVRSLVVRAGLSEEERTAAEARFHDVQQAYETLSKLHKQREGKAEGEGPRSKNMGDSRSKRRARRSSRDEL